MRYSPLFTRYHQAVGVLGPLITQYLSDTSPSIFWSIFTVSDLISDVCLILVCEYIYRYSNKLCVDYVNEMQENYWQGNYPDRHGAEDMPSKYEKRKCFEIQCDRCGGTFMQGRASQRFCCEECGKAFHRINTSEFRKLKQKLIDAYQVIEELKKRLARMEEN